MTIFQHLLWGYEISYPDNWVHQQSQDMDVFAATTEALDHASYDELDAGQLIIRGEWNWARQSIEPLWNQHITKLASMHGAKNIGSAPWRIGDAVGIEAEIVLPKKENRRLWMGILAYDFRIIHFMVSHPKEVRDQFEPEATKIIASLRFPTHISGVILSPEGLPLPPNYTQVDATGILDDITDPQLWRAYTGDAEIGAMQAFYLRELTNNIWQIDEYIPFPSESELGFARYKLNKDNKNLILGLIPYRNEDNTIINRTNVVYKLSE